MRECTGHGFEDRSIPFADVTGDAAHSFHLITLSLYHLTTNIKSIICFARLSQVQSLTFSCATATRLADNSFRSNAALMPSAKRAGSSGLTSSAISSVNISRMAGKSDATIGRPAIMYSNNLSGDVS